MNNKERRWWNQAMGRVLAKKLDTIGLTATALAREAGLSVSTVNTALSGRGTTSWLSLHLMLKTIGTGQDSAFLNLVAHEYEELSSIFKPKAP
jgi:lambda repressor-like predicted transcriptional regulator